MHAVSLFAWGLLGMIQALVLPGLCITASVPAWNRVQRLLFALPLSLALNHYAVCLLVFFGIYTRAALLGLVGLEVAWLVYCFYWTRPPRISYLPLRNHLDLFLLGGAVAAFTKYVQAFGRSFGDIFQMWDAVVSWNGWARQWAAGMLPPSGMYPHGLPITYSLPYVFLQRSDVETFSRASSGFFFLGAIAALIELGFRKVEYRRIAWLVAYLYPAVQASFLQSHWQSGYADVPLAAFVVFAFCLHTFETREGAAIYGLVAGAAPLVKQPGLLFTAVSPLLYKAWSPLQAWKKKQEWLTLWISLGVFATLTAVPWYLFILVRIYGMNKSGGNNMGYLANLVPGGLLTRWEFTFKLLLGYSSIQFLLACGFFNCIALLKPSPARRWLLLLGLPYFFIWGTFFGYDIRNISMALFPLSLGMATGIAHVFTFISGKISLAGKTPRWVLPSFLLRPAAPANIVIGLTVIMLAVSLKRPIENWREAGGLLAREKQLRIELGEFARANKVIYGLSQCETLKKFPVYSNDPWHGAIPEIREFIRSASCESVFERAAKKTEEAYAMLSAESCPGLADKMKAIPGVIYSEPGLVYVFGLKAGMPSACP